MASRRVARTEWSERKARVGCGGGERRSGGVEKKKKLEKSGEGMGKERRRRGSGERTRRKGNNLRVRGGAGVG